MTSPGPGAGSRPWGDPRPDRLHIISSQTPRVGPVQPGGGDGGQGARKAGGYGLGRVPGRPGRPAAHAMGQCLGRQRRPQRTAVSFIPLYDAEPLGVDDDDEASASEAEAGGDDPHTRALQRLHATQGRLARRHAHLLESEQHARRRAVEAWAKRPDRPATDPALHAYCRRQAQFALHEARQYAASAGSVNALELQLVTLKVQLATMRVSADALGALNDYSSQLAGEVRALRERVDLRTLLRTIEHNADALADLRQTQDAISDAVLTEGIDEAQVEAELDVLEQEFARTSLRETVVRGDHHTPPSPTPARRVVNEGRRLLTGMLAQ